MVLEDLAADFSMRVQVALERGRFCSTSVTCSSVIGALALAGRDQQAAELGVHGAHHRCHGRQGQGMAVSPVLELLHQLRGSSLATACGVVQFIYISREEMEAVADFIQQKGRVAISELAAKSNTFIDLEAKAAAPPPDMAAVLDLDLDEDGGQEGVSQ